jgi:hypothetical protein
MKEGLQIIESIPAKLFQNRLLLGNGKGIMKEPYEIIEWINKLNF